MDDDFRELLYKTLFELGMAAVVAGLGLFCYRILVRFIPQVIASDFFFVSIGLLSAILLLGLALAAHSSGISNPFVAFMSIVLVFLTVLSILATIGQVTDTPVTSATPRVTAAIAANPNSIQSTPDRKGAVIDCKSRSDRPIRQILLFRDGILERPSAPSPISITFLDITVPVPIFDRDVVCLSSSPDEPQELRVDDQLQLVVYHSDGTPAIWVQDFYNDRTGGIRPFPAIDISNLFFVGNNMVRVELRDFKPPYYSAKPMWLIIWSASP